MEDILGKLDSYINKVRELVEKAKKVDINNEREVKQLLSELTNIGLDFVSEIAEFKAKYPEEAEKLKKEIGKRVSQLEGLIIRVKIELDRKMLREMLKAI